MTATPHVLSHPNPTPYTPTTTPGSASATPATAPPTGRKARKRGHRPPTERTWRRLSAAFTRQVRAVAGRRDVTVTMAPGAGRGSPGCFVPALKVIELDPSTLPAEVRPTTVRPNQPTDRERYAATWGVFVHECAHSRHTRWDLPRPNTTPGATTPGATGSTGHGTKSSGAPKGSATSGSPAVATPPSGVHGKVLALQGTAVMAAAVLLEESRIEAAHVARRPSDRRWLRASTTTLIMSEMARLDPGAAQPISAWTAGHAAALVLARVDAGVLDETEAETVTTAVTRVVGAERLAQLRDIWRAAHRTGDEDTDAMLDLGRRWCHVLGVDPSKGEPDGTSNGQSGGGGQSGARATGAAGEPSPVLVAVRAALDAVHAADAGQVSDGIEQALAAKAAAREAEQAVQRETRHAARTVFGGPDAGATRGGETRPPTEAESSAARRLARTLRDAGTRDRVTTTKTSATPPGRLSMRAALAADAQKAAGAVPTAEPFTRTTRRHVPTPPLRIGIACDISGSMHSVASAIASTAWIVNRAVVHVPDAKAATVIYGETVRPITRPGHTPSGVREFQARDRYERFTLAVDALDGALDLTRRDAARLLVIVSDGRYKNQEPTLGQQRIDRLRTSGCGVLWITLADAKDTPRPMSGTHVLTLQDPATAADAIARAAATTLRNA